MRRGEVGDPPGSSSRSLDSGAWTRHDIPGTPPPPRPRRRTADEDDLVRARRARARVPAGRGARRLRARGRSSRTARRSCPTAPQPATRRSASHRRVARRRARAACCSRTARCRASCSLAEAPRARPRACWSRSRPTTGALKIRSSARRLDRPVPLDDEGIDPRRARATRSRTAEDRRVPLHDPDLPEPERTHAVGRAARADRRDRASSRTAASSRTTRTASSATRASRSRRSSTSRTRRFIYSSSFSKTIAPGLRVGWYVLPEELAGEITEAAALDLHHAGAAEPGGRLRVPPPRQLRAEPRARHRPAPRTPRRDARGARRSTCRAARGSHPEGGYFIWLEFPRGTLRDRRARAGRGRHVRPGLDFGGMPNAARLAFSFVSPEEIEVGVERIAAVL